MKILLIMLCLTTGVFAQEKIYNVQHYCIDNKPFTSNDCDSQGNEYSFVFVDRSKNEVVLFLADNKITYTIVEEVKGKSTEAIGYKLKNAQGLVEMSINPQKTRIEFLEPLRKITLKVGKSTKTIN